MIPNQLEVEPYIDVIPWTPQNVGELTHAHDLASCDFEDD